MFTGICGIRRIVMQINTSINLGRGFKKANADDFLFLCSKKITSLNVMTKIVLKLNCGDSNPPVLAENLPFVESIFGLPFSLNILLVFETLPS